MEPTGAGLTSIKAEVPMADVLTYSQSLTSLTGGRGDYTLAFLRYEEVPSHIAQKVMDAAKKGVRVTVVRRQDVQRTCAICHRTLLMGERAIRFTPGATTGRRLRALHDDGRRPRLDQRETRRRRSCRRRAAEGASVGSQGCSKHAVPSPSRT